MQVSTTDSETTLEEFLLQDNDEPNADSTLIVKLCMPIHNPSTFPRNLSELFNAITNL